MTRTVPSERFRRELDEALAGVDRDDDPVETIGIWDCESGRRQSSEQAGAAVQPRENDRWNRRNPARESSQSRHQTGTASQPAQLHSIEKCPLCGPFTMGGTGLEPV